MKNNQKNQSALRFVVCKGFTKEVLADFPNIVAANTSRDDFRKSGTLASVRVANRTMREGVPEFAFI